MSEHPTGSYWMDRPLTELSREELIEAVERLGRDLKEARKRHLRSLDTWQMAQNARRPVQVNLERKESTE